MGKIAEDKIRTLAGQVADECGYEVFDLNILGKGNRSMLRVFIDKEGGVTLDDCEEFSRRFGALLDVEDPIAGRYTLEVSSPGLDRPLKSLIDFERNIGRQARIVTHTAIDNQSFFLGRIKAVAGNVITVSMPDNKKDVDIPYEAISKAKLEIELK